MEQEIGGYGNISSTSSFESYPEIAEYFLENVNLAKEHLEEILEIGDDEERIQLTLKKKMMRINYEK
jgi:hypothetical protein